MNFDKNPSFTKLELLLASSKYVFSIDDLCLLWSQNDRKKVSDLAGWYTDNGKLYRLSSGLFSTKNIFKNPVTPAIFLVAQKLLTPSYLSYHTILTDAGINFQYYQTIHSCALVNKTLKIAGVEFVYHKIPEQIFFNPLGIILDEFGISKASPERAVIDAWYINSSIGLDNTASLNPSKLLEIALVYNKPKIYKNLKAVFDISLKPKI